LGYFNTLEEATKIRKQAEEKFYEPFLEWFDKNCDTLFDK